MKKTEEIKGLEQMCESYQEEIKKVRDDAREAIKISESQAMEGRRYSNIFQNPSLFEQPL